MATPTLIRFSDLEKRGIVHNWVTLLRWIEREGFPPGFRLGPNCRAWFEEEIDAWLESRRIKPGEAQDANAS
jgi:predicted DNA-binding transcriptional regulator AlpA